MESRGDKTVTGIPRWACPWAAGRSGVHKKSAPHDEGELLSLATRDRSPAEIGLSKNSRRRIQRIGVTANGVAAAVWVLAVGWALQNIS